MKMKSITLDSSSVQARLALCAAALAGTAATVPNAQATVITNNINLAVPMNTAGVYLNFLTGASGGAPFAGWDFNPYGTAALSFYWQPTPAASHGGVGTGSAYLDLSPGTTISAASPFSITLSAAGSPFRTAGTHILGFRFFNENTSAINYGYLTIMNGATMGTPATILSYSYEDGGGAITIPVPEPATNALLAVAALALGALGVRAWRRQQSA